MVSKFSYITLNTNINEKFAMYFSTLIFLNVLLKKYKDLAFKSGIDFRWPFVKKILKFWIITLSVKVKLTQKCFNYFVLDCLVDEVKFMM